MRSLEDLEKIVSEYNEGPIPSAAKELLAWAKVYRDLAIKNHPKQFMRFDYPAGMNFIDAKKALQPTVIAEIDAEAKRILEEK